jgi:hypothetical protein
MAEDNVSNILENYNPNGGQVYFDNAGAEQIDDLKGSGAFSQGAETGVEASSTSGHISNGNQSYNGKVELVKYTKKNGKQVYIELVDRDGIYDSGARIIGEYDSYQEFLAEGGDEYFPSFDDVGGYVETGKDGTLAKQTKMMSSEERGKADAIFDSKVHVKDEEGETIAGSEEIEETTRAEIEASNKEYDEKFRDKISDYGGQSFLMENIRPFIQFAAGGTYESIVELGEYEGGYGNPDVLKLVSTERPEGLIHALISQKTKELLAFQQGTPEMFSLLVPQIRLFHQRNDGNEIVIPFSMHTEYFSKDPTVALQNREGRGDDVGLISFDWQFDSGKVALATGGGKSGKANLSLFFQSPEAIIKRRYAQTVGGKSLYFRYDQLLSPNLSDAKDNEIKYVNNGVIRALITYGVTTNAEKLATTSVDKKTLERFFKAAKSMHTSLYLSPSTEYELDFQETGGVNLSIEYTFQVEEVLNDPKINIFSTKMTQVKKKLEAAKLAKEEAAKDKNSMASSVSGVVSSGTGGIFNLTPEDKAIQALEKEFRIATNEVYGPIKDRIMGKVHGITLTRGSLENYLFVRGWKNEKGDGSGNNYWETKLNVKASEMRKNEFVNPSTEGSDGQFLADDGTVDIQWVYFGDIISAIIDNETVKAQLNEEGIKVLLGQVFLVESLRGVNGVGGEPVPILVNIGDIPINMTLFNKFWTNTIVKKKVVNLNFFEFIRKLTNFLLNPILNNSDTLRGVNVLRTTEITTLFYTGGKKNSTEELRDKTTGRLVVDDITDISLGSLSENNPIRKKDKIGYCLITGEFSNVPVKYNGSEFEDSLFGVMHYYLARDRGLLKSASFSKTSVKLAREMQLAKAYDEQAIAPQTAFWSPFNTNLVLMGNPNVQWGMQYFVNPTMPGMGTIKNKSSAAYALQIGGYYSATSVSNSLSISGWETNVEGQLLNSINTSYNPTKADGPNRKAKFIS